VLDLDTLAARFEAAAIPAVEWTHHAHICVGAWHVHHLGPQTALARLRAGIRRLNEAHGTVNSTTRGYHETITAAYVRLITHFFAACPADMPLPDRAAALLSSALAERSYLLRHYTRDRLMSPAARAAWIEPDLEPLP
jgi:hypothetical protein